MYSLCKHAGLRKDGETQDVSKENINILALSTLHNRKSWQVRDLQSMFSSFGRELQAHQSGFSKAPEDYILQQQNTEAE